MGETVLSEVVPAIERAGLHITDVEVLRLHYAHTLRAWRDRFMADLYDARFCRMWEFYLAYCEARFRHSGLVVFQIQISKRIDAVTITRDYIAAGEQGASSMSELIVIGYDTEAEADAARTKLFGMAKEYLVDVADAVVARADENGKIKLNQMVNLWTTGASGGAFWGLLIGFLFMNPLLHHDGPLLH